MDASVDADPRDEPAPFWTVVGLTTLSAVAVIALSRVAGASNWKFLLLGPIALVVYEVVVHEVWWKRWWGAIPGAAVGAAVYFEGAQALADLVGRAWAEPVAYVAAWAAFAAVFCLASRWPAASPGSRPG
ncbi:hypothetical protein [Thermoactinospora rubra]|uniref:hypothetical protein n=1 Tax=Thermoactinospora rubra TaxID=1088767 RepID=UPI00117F56C4|nr:hypothetical protein [Thermoactinospora rubra]